MASLVLDTDHLPDDVVGTLDELRHARRVQQAAEARQLRLAAHFADLNAAVDAHSTGLPGVEQLRQVAGEGTPQIAEFATLELAAVLGMNDVEALALVADALDLRHRLPELWGQVHTGEVPVWQARAIAVLVRPLGRDAARLVGLQLERTMPGCAGPG